MTPKYIGERYRNYFIFGTHPTNGTVDINDGDVDVCSATLEQADKLISDRDEVLELIHLFNERYPDQFNECFKILNK